MIILLMAGFWAIGLLSYIQKRCVTHVAIVFSAMGIVFGGLYNWGHAGWTEHAFTSDFPPLSDPAHTTILLTREPTAWIIPDFPATVAVGILDGSFPKTALYTQKVHAMVENRRGPAYAIAEASHTKFIYNDTTADALNRYLSRLGVLQNLSICKLIDPDHRKLNWTQRTENGRYCEFMPKNPLLLASDRELVAQTDDIARKYGLRLDRATCKTFTAHIGAQPLSYQWCRVLPV